MFVLPFSYGSKDQFPLISATCEAKNSGEKCPHTNIIDTYFRLIIVQYETKSSQTLFIIAAVSEKKSSF